MRTSRPFSTISYNSAEFLTSILDDLLRSRKIDFYAFVEHFPEEDEKKKHKHCYIVPNGKIDTDPIRDLLIEVDPSNPLSLPLGAMPFKPSKFADWYLYNCHDVNYLASKGQSRKYHYTKDDFTASDPDYFNEEIHTIDHTKYNRYNEFVRAIEQGRSFADVLASGLVPMQQTYAWEKAFNILEDHYRTNRGGRTSHQEYSIDPETGEFLDAVPGDRETHNETPSETSENPTWCGATHNEWAELYESASTDEELP